MRTFLCVTQEAWTSSSQWRIKVGRMVLEEKDQENAVYIADTVPCVHIHPLPHAETDFGGILGLTWEHHPYGKAWCRQPRDQIYLWVNINSDSSENFFHLSMMRFSQEQVYLLRSCDTFAHRWTHGRGSEQWWKLEGKMWEGKIWTRTQPIRVKQRKKHQWGSRRQKKSSHTHTSKHTCQHTHAQGKRDACERGRAWGITAEFPWKPWARERARAAATPASALAARTHLPSSSSSLPCAPLSPSLRHC